MPTPLHPIKEIFMRRFLTLLVLILTLIASATAQRTMSAPRVSTPRVSTPSISRPSVTPRTTTPTNRVPSSTRVTPGAGTAPMVSRPSARPVTPFPPVSRTAPASSYRSYNRYESPNGFANALPWLFLWDAADDVAEAQFERAEAGQTEIAADQVTGLNLWGVFVVVAGALILVLVILFIVRLGAS